MAEMPPLPQQPVQQDAGLTRSELMPFRSTKISLRRSRMLWPLVALALACVLLFTIRMKMQSKDDVVSYMNVLASFILFAMFVGVYSYSGARKPMPWYAVPAVIVMFELVFSPVLRGFMYVFRVLLPGDMKGEGFLPNFIGMFFGAGLMEELMKAVPLLLALLLAYYLRARNSEGNWLTRNLALQGPLDGVLMGAAAGAGFIAVETMGMYVPSAMRGGGANAALGALQGITLMVPRVLNGLIGHMAYAAIFGYFIGLAVTHRRSAFTLLAIGWLFSSVLHAFWNSGVHLMGPAAFYVSAALTAFFFLACLLKAKQLEISRLGEAVSGHSVLAVSPQPAPTAFVPGGGVAPRSPGIMGGIGELAGVGGSSAGAAPAMPPSGLSIGTWSARYALAPNQNVDFSALFGADGVLAGYAGFIVQAADGGLEMHNTGSAPWNYATPDGVTISVQPGAAIRPLAGAKLLLGPATVDITSY